jgi:hypothetical protein
VFEKKAVAITLGALKKGEAQGTKSVIRLHPSNKLTCSWLYTSVGGSTLFAASKKGDMRRSKRITAALNLLWLVPCLTAASLKTETKEAWAAYLQAATDAMQARLQSGSHFLWLDDEAGRREHVRNKGPYILPLGDQIPKPVPSGLIHDWLGAGFVPHATIPEILKVVRDYDHYADIYRPGVIASKFERADGSSDLFFLRFANKSAVAKTALDTEEEARFIQVDEHRWYGYSITTHIREVAKFGTAEEHTLPEDEGTGLIWRLASFTRLEERDGGVYAELEALALSRDIPAAFRLIVDPIVRRVSRSSLATSLHQTKIAIDDRREGRLPR